MTIVRHGDVGDWRLADEPFLASFRLPTALDKCESLASRNRFPRETRILFNETEHVYTVDGVRVPRSVTGLVHKFVESFDPRDAIEAMQNGAHWEVKRQLYTNDAGELLTPDEIVCKWARNGEVQRARGQLLHYHAEQFLNGRAVEHPLSPEFRQFLAIHRTLLGEGLRVYRTELSVFHCGLRLAGQIDLLCLDAAGAYVVVDWKRCKQMRYDTRQPMKEPLCHLPSCNWYTYSLQLNLSAHILTSEYGLAVGRMLLGIVHPDKERGQLLSVPFLREEVESIVEHERAMGCATEVSVGDAFRTL